MNTTSRSGRRGRTALSVITAGITGGAILVGIAFAIDALNSDSHAPTSEMATNYQLWSPAPPTSFTTATDYRKRPVRLCRQTWR